MAEEVLSVRRPSSGSACLRLQLRWALLQLVVHRLPSASEVLGRGGVAALEEFLVLAVAVFLFVEAMSAVAHLENSLLDGLLVFLVVTVHYIFVRG